MLLQLPFQAIWVVQAGGTSSFMPMWEVWKTRDRPFHQLCEPSPQAFQMVDGFIYAQQTWSLNWIPDKFLDGIYIGTVSFSLPQGQGRIPGRVILWIYC